MKNIITILFCLISIGSFSQNIVINESLNPFLQNNSTFDFEKGMVVSQPKSEWMSKVEKSFKEKNVGPLKATINDWEIALKGIGKVFRKENTFLSCSISDKNFVQLSFINNYLFSFCETKDDGKPDKKERNYVLIDAILLFLRN